MKSFSAWALLLLLWALFAGFIALIIAVFIKGSRPPQPVESPSDINRHPVGNAVLAILTLGISILVFYLGVWSGFTNDRVFDALITLPLVIGAFCGRRAFRSKSTIRLVRVLGLLAVIVCVPSAIAFLFVTIFGVG